MLHNRQLCVGIINVIKHRNPIVTSLFNCHIVHRDSALTPIALAKTRDAWTKHSKIGRDGIGDDSHIATSFSECELGRGRKQRADQSVLSCLGAPVNYEWHVGVAKTQLRQMGIRP